MRTAHSPLLLREIRRGFSEKSYFYLKITVSALEFPDSLVIRHSIRDLLPGKLFPVRLYPKTQCGIIHFEFSPPVQSAASYQTTLLAACSLNSGVYRFDLAGI